MAGLSAFVRRRAGVVTIVVAIVILLIGYGVYQLVARLTVVSVSQETDPQIAYLSYDYDNPETLGALYLVNMTTGNYQQITRGGKLGYYLKWLPDGKTLALVDDDQVRLLNIATGDLTDTGQTLQSWSPDGRVVLSTDRLYRLNVYDPVSKKTTTVAKISSTVDDPLGALTPDGKSVAFPSQEPGDADPDIYLVNTDGTNKRKFITDPGKNDYTVLWSPDGKHLLLETAENDEAGARSKLTLFVGDPDGSNLVRVGDAYARHPSISWSPDSSKIVWVQTKDLFPCVASVSGKDTLCEKGQSTVHVEWSPDSTQIAYDNNFVAPHTLCVVSASTMDKPTCYTLPGPNYTPSVFVWRP